MSRWHYYIHVALVVAVSIYPVCLRIAVVHLLPNATDVYRLTGGCGTCTSTRNVYYYTVGLENIKLVLHVARAIFDYSFRYRHTKSAPGRGSRFRYPAASCCNSIAGVSLIKYHFTPPPISIYFSIVLPL